MITRSRKLRSLVCASALTPLVALLAPGTAAAEPGDHITLGSAKIVPTLQAAGEFQTNAYLEEGGTGSEPDPGLALRIRPAGELNYGTEDLKLSLGAGWTMRQYLTQETQNLNRYGDFDVLLGMNILPDAVVGFKLSEDLRNRARAADVGNNDDPNAIVPTDSNLRRLSNKTLAMIAVHPGGALSVNVGGHVDVDRYAFPEASVEGDEPAANTKLGFGPNLNAQWRFFPKTAVVLDASAESYSWTPNARTDDNGAVTGLPDGFQFRATTGIKGRVTDRVQVALMAGYGQLLADEQSVIDAATGTVDTAGLAQDLKGFPDGLLAVAELTWAPTDNHALTGGVRKEFSDVYFTNYVNYLNFFGRYEGRYFDKLKVLGEMNFRTEDYVGDINRSDTFLRGRVDLAWELARFLDLGGGVIYASRTNVDGSSPGVDYQNLTAVFGATLTY